MESQCFLNLHESICQCCRLFLLRAAPMPASTVSEAAAISAIAVRTSRFFALLHRTVIRLHDGLFCILLACRRFLRSKRSPCLHSQGHDDREEDRQAFRKTNSSHIVVSFVRTTVFSILPFLRKKCDASPFSHYEKGAESQRTPHLTLLNRFYQKPGSTPASTYACLKPPISLIIWYLRTNKKALELFKLQRLYYGDPGAIRTRDTCLRRAVLYPLSYGASCKEYNNRMCHFHQLFSMLRM